MTTVLKVLRDIKLKDGTLMRLSLVPDTSEIEVSKVSGNDSSLSTLRLPDTTEVAFELLQMAYKLLHKDLQEDLANPSHN